jgi:hypothetical protein
MMKKTLVALFLVLVVVLVACASPKTATSPAPMRYSAVLASEQVTFGSPDAVTFKPEMTLYRWGNECYMKVSYPTTRNIAPTLNNGTLTWTDTQDGIQISWYAVPANDEEPEGSLEMNVVLLKKPKTNQIIFDLESQGLQFWLQPSLKEDAAYWHTNYGDDITITDTQVIRNSDGSVLAGRAENVLDSYSVFGYNQDNFVAMGGKNYKDGKAFHIYRPQPIDSAGVKCWGNITIPDDLSHIIYTIPQDFLDSATYPIYHATGAYFGYTGGSSYETALNCIRTSTHTGAAGVAYSMTATIQMLSNTGPPCARCALYNATTNALVLTTEEWCSKTGTVTHTFNISPYVEVFPISYRLAIWIGYYSTNGLTWYNTSWTGAYMNYTYNGVYPSTFTVSATDTHRHALYCNYTPKYGAANIATIDGVSWSKISTLDGVTYSTTKSVDGVT